MNAVIYARYSSDNQREESIEGQIRECTAYAERNGITVVRHYIDRAFSAKTDHRPDFQQMIRDSNKKLFEIVLVWKFDRFARNRFDSANYKMILKKNNVHLISVMEPIAEGSQGILVETLLETSVYKGYKRDKIEMRGDRAEISDFPLYLNTVAGGLDRRDQTIGGFSFVVKIYALPVVEIIGQLLYLLGRYGFNAQFGDCL